MTPDDAQWAGYVLLLTPLLLGSFAFIVADWLSGWLHRECCVELPEDGFPLSNVEVRR